MTVRQLLTGHYEMSAGDTKPTKGVAPVATIREIDTNQMWITYDGGVTWIIADKRMRLVTEDGAFIDLVTALTAMEALKTYEFTMNGVNFNGYANIKMLTLDSDAKDDTPITLHDAGVDYAVPANHIFIAFQALIWLQQIGMVGRIGGAGGADGVITKEVLKFSNGTTIPWMTDCIGVFTAGEYITAETDSASASYQIKSGSVLYGVEIDIS